MHYILYSITLYYTKLLHVLCNVIHINVLYFTIGVHLLSILQYWRERVHILHFICLSMFLVTNLLLPRALLYSSGPSESNFMNCTILYFISLSIAFQGRLRQVKFLTSVPYLIALYSCCSSSRIVAPSWIWNKIIAFILLNLDHTYYLSWWT